MVSALGCRLRQRFITGDHTLLVGNVLVVYANGGISKEGEIYSTLTKPILHLGGDDFVTIRDERTDTKST